MKAAGYIRVSGIHQVDNESLGIQWQAIRSYAESQGYEVAKYEDAGISGASVEKRHKLQELLNDAKLKKFDIVIVHNLSRFGRNVRELLNITLNCFKIIKLVLYLLKKT